METTWESPRTVIRLAMEIGATIRRSEDDPPLTRTLVRMIGQEFTTDDSAARRELGYAGKVSRTEGLAAYDV